MIRLRNILTFALVLVLLADLTGCRGKKPSSEAPKDNPAPTGNDPNNTPEAVFNTAMGALKEETRAFIDCFSPEGQKDMATNMTFDSLRGQAIAHESRDEKAKARYKDIVAALDKHGLNYEVTKKLKFGSNRKERDKASAELSGLIKDPAGLFVDLSNAMMKRDGPRKIDVLPTLGDMKIDGDKATGKALMNDRFGQSKAPVDFVKVDGKWKVAKLGEPEPAGPSDGPVREKEKFDPKDRFRDKDKR